MTAQYQSLLWPDAGPIQPGKKSSNPRMNLRGCEYCSLNGAKGIVKIKGTVEGKDIMVWAQSPGPKENAYRKEVDGEVIRGKELVGPAGKWFWERMAEAGLSRKDCDIQNMVRCFPADWDDGRLVMRNPTKDEIFCCSLYTDQAIAKSRAKVHIVLGQIAAKQLFGKKFTGEKIFWSDKLRGRVVILDHPAFFVRGYGSEARQSAFRAGLRAAAEFVTQERSRYAYLEAQDYRGITIVAKAEQVAEKIRAKATKGIRISVDIEDANVGGKRVILCVGFSWEPGVARVFLVDHPMPGISEETREGLRKVVSSLLADENIKKVCHHGSYDGKKVKQLLDCRFLGYDFDTNYSEYFAYPGRWSYALAEIAAVRFPNFSGFKEVVMPEAAPEGMSYDKAYKMGKLDFGKVPWEKLVLRNAADADITKRIEISTKRHVKLPLLRVYMDAAFTLDRMEPNGPLFDYKQCDLLGQIYPARLERQRQELQMMAGNPNLNPNTPAEIAQVIYGTLKLPVIGKKPNTRHKTLEILARRHPFPKKVVAYRKDLKIETTYRVGYKKCADANKGRLITKWWLTGTITGRLSSGGSREGEEKLTVNLQNIHGDPQLQNLLVSDVGWRDIYEAWKEEKKRVEDIVDRIAGEWWKPFLDRKVYLVLDYSQNELRFLAESSNDELLISQFQSGKDIHCAVGHELTGWSEAHIAKDKKTRVLIKGFHFGLLYGLTADGLYDHLVAAGVKIARKKVAKMYKRYFERYFGVRKYMKQMRRMAEDEHYVENILGFRCPIDPSGDYEGGYWENLAVNAPIQGGAHQLVLMALAALKRKPQTYSLIRTPEAEIHDALTIPVALRDLFAAFKMAKHLLEKEVLQMLKDDFELHWRVPLKADSTAGFRYGVTVEFDPEKGLGQFLEDWCTANQESQRKLFAELKKVREANPVS